MAPSEKKDLETLRAGLRRPLLYCKGVGPNIDHLLRRLNLFRAYDLLFYFPRDYQDLSRFVRIADLKEDEIQTVRGEIIDFHRRFTRRGPMVTLTVEDEFGDRLEALWFNQAWHFDQFRLGARLLLTGKPVWKRNHPQMSHPRLLWQDRFEDSPSSVDWGEDFTPGEEDPKGEGTATSENGMGSETVPFDPFLPVYPLTEGLRQYQLHKIIKNLLVDLPDGLDDVFSEEFRNAHQLLPIAEAVRKIHFPKSLEEAASARRRFIYQELFLLQLALAIRRQQHEVSLKAPSLPWSEKIDSRIRRLVPFDLTESQNRVIREIAEDLTRPVPMNRLLQGDVGSGKTIVATFAALQTVAAGYQAVLMAPTEVLARQHLRFLTRLLEGTAVRITPLFGGQRPKEREEFLRQIREGESGIIVGTQAILSEGIEFHRLGLVVIDEQHKFGVRQRARLKTGTGSEPHYLVMTATPIPRSVTMTVFGDLDVSILDGLPPGRQPVHTYVVGREKQASWWTFFRKKIAQGRQGYVVVPRVEENDDDLRSVSETCRELSSGALAGVRLGVLHGRMTSEEKEAVMIDFRSREIEVLVATSVIEVGVDVPNATLMTIENGNLFGLAQLHQLRGRIRRGRFPGYCAVFPSEKQEKEEETPPKESGAKRRKRRRMGDDPEAEETKQVTNDSIHRLETFASSTDGFLLAEKDFEMRGPGDLFGTEQHGLCHFRIADLVRDKKVVAEARADALAMVRNDPGLADPAHAALRRQVLVRYGQVLDLGDVG